MHALSVETAVLIQSCVVAPLLFLILYSMRTHWWTTVHGRTLAALSLVFVIVLLPECLIYWHALSIADLAQGWVSWVVINALVLAPLAFLTMSWQLLRKPLQRWLKARKTVTEDPLTEDAPAPRLKDYDPQPLRKYRAKDN